MKTKRLVVETTSSRKEALETVLRQEGKTLSEWLAEQIDSLLPDFVPLDTSDVPRLTELSTLNDSTKVFGRLKKIDWSFVDSDTNYLTHGLHPYPAKFIPQLPHYLIEQLSLPGEVVWDPFGGSGTTALESLLLGRRPITSDLNPIATLIAEAKCTSLTPDDEKGLLDLLSHLEHVLSSHSVVASELDRQSERIEKFIPNIPHIDKWFHPQSVRELGYLRYHVDALRNKKCKVVGLSAFSKIVLRSSFQDSETRYSSKPRKVVTGEILQLFLQELKTSLKRSRSVSSLIRFREGRFITADIRNEAVVQADSVDLIVTSPPYPNATDYHLYHRFRMFWLGYDPRQMASSEIGSHLRHQKEGTGVQEYFEEIELSLGKCFYGLRAGRYAAIVMGDAVFDGKRYNLVDMLHDRAVKIGFEFVGNVPRMVHRSKRSFMVSARRIESEWIVILRKPDRVMRFELLPATYKLWPYEEKVCIKEIGTVVGKAPARRKDHVNLTLELSPLRADRLKKLTFVQGFRANGYNVESTWQSTLENGDLVADRKARKDPKYSTHGLHPYKGKFYPQLARSLFNLASVPTGSIIFDPFCGSGTVVLEGYLNGFRAVGFDINPLAVKIATAKTKILKCDPYVTENVLNDFIKRIKSHISGVNLRDLFSEDCVEELTSWFPRPVLLRLGRIMKEIESITNPIHRDFLQVCVSSIVRDVSQQEPRDLRIRRRVVPLTDAPVIEILEARLVEQRQRLRHFAERSNKAPVPFGSTDVFEEDARDKEGYARALISNGSVQCIVTSPPYATALPYIDTDRLSILLLFGMRSPERSKIERSLIGSREIQNRDKYAIEEDIQRGSFGDIVSSTAVDIITRLYKLNSRNDAGFRRMNMASLLYRYFADMTRVLNNLANVVMPGGSLIFVIGDNKTQAGGQTLLLESGRFLRETAELLGWQIVDDIPITVTQENRLHNKNSITENEILWFRKGSS